MILEHTHQTHFREGDGTEHKTIVCPYLYDEENEESDAYLENLGKVYVTIHGGPGATLLRTETTEADSIANAQAPDLVAAMDAMGSRAYRRG